MNIQIVVRRESKANPKLEMEEWIFITFERSNETWLVLDKYSKQSRASTRHGWKIDRASNYRRIFSRESTLGEAEVPLPTDVLAEAKAEFISKIHVGLWDRDYNRVDPNRVT